MMISSYVADEMYILTMLEISNPRGWSRRYFLINFLSGKRRAFLENLIVQHALVVH